MKQAIYSSIEDKRKKLKQKRQELEEGQLNALRELIPNTVIEKICREYRYSYRRRLITPIVTVFHMLSAAISREGSFESAWHMSGQAGKSGTLAKARQRLPLMVWQRLGQWVVNRIYGEFKDTDTWKSFRLIGIDATGVSMSDEPSLEVAFGKSESILGRGHFPVARVGFAFGINTCVTLMHCSGKLTDSEQRLYRKLTDALGPGDLIIGDAGLSAANYYARYTRKGVEFICHAHPALKVENQRVIKEIDRDDMIIRLNILRHHRKQDKSLPASVCVRVLKVNRYSRAKGKQEKMWIATSLLDAEKYPAHEIRRLHKSRWKVETLIGEVKLWLGADILRSRKVEAIRKELEARILAFNIIHWLILKAAKHHKKDHYLISTAATLRLATCYSSKMSTAPFWRLIPLYKTMLFMISRSIKLLRPDRVEPRMLKRRKTHDDFPILKISRKEWKRINAFAA